MMRNAPGLDRMAYPGLEATGKTIGIVGLGNIGRRTAKIAKHALNMNVIAYDPHITAADFAERDATSVDFDTLFATADFISVHCPLTKETRGMIGAEAFARMKPSAYFITTARGFIHDEAALVTALAKGQMNGAGVDVFDAEPCRTRPSADAVRECPDDTARCGDHRCLQLSHGPVGAEQWIEVLNGKRAPRLVNPACWDAYVERHQRIIGHAPEP